MTVLEAMACACPVVAYPGGSVAEVVGTGGTIVADGDQEALLRSVRRLTGDENARQAARDVAHARARQFDVGRSVESLVQEYKAVLAGV
jgi:glycosyltransferase involved in cell wall biosynthesis